MGSLIKKKHIGQATDLSIKQFYEMKDKVLILRETGGLGDILMQRMMFEDFKAMLPDTELHFACPHRYHDALTDHPYIDKILDSRTVNIYDYIATYNITSACTRHEMRVLDNSDTNRSDIWANHCGVELKNHNMHINLEEEYVKFGKETVEKARNGYTGPAVCICPVSAMMAKNLLDWQLEGLVNGLRDRGCFVYAVHSLYIPKLIEMKVPVIYGISTRQWMGMINAADYVVSVDTSSFHLAGGIKKPLTGIFTFADGVIYGRWYDFVLVQKHKKNGDWPCGPCYNWPNCPISKETLKPCLTTITVKMIMDGVDKMFEKWPNDRTHS